jgi:Na+-transporting NADH:ubiquinone oxidoreductase subunit D
MSADKKSSEPLFSKKNKKLITDPLTDNNPVTIQVLGICSALAITVQVNQAIVMSLSVLFVIAKSYSFSDQNYCSITCCGIFSNYC